LLIKYINVLCRAAKRLSYIEDARCLKVNLYSFVLGLTPFGWLRSVTLLFWWECHLGCWPFFIYPPPPFSGTQLGHKSKAWSIDSPLLFSSVRFSCRGSPLTKPRSFRSPFHFVSCDLFIILFDAVLFRVTDTNVK